MVSYDRKHVFFEDRSLTIHATIVIHNSRSVPRPSVDFIKTSFDHSLRERLLYTLRVTSNTLATLFPSLLSTSAPTAIEPYWHLR